MADDIDSMLGLPMMEGGGIDKSFSVLTLDEILEKKTDVQTVPIIMTEKTPTGTRDLGDLGSFLLSTGLQATDILGLNGEAVRKLINTPSDKVDAINPKLFLVKNLYEGVDELVEKQVVFISLFHHLFFLAKLAKTPDFPLFTDSFSNKFAAVQKGIQEIKGEIKIEEPEKSTVAGAADLSTEAGFDSTSIQEGSQGAPVSSSIFGVSFAEIAKFWNELNTKFTLAETIEIFKKSPAEIYDWFVSDLPKSSAVAPAPAPADIPAKSTEVNTSEVKAEGATSPALGVVAEEPVPESKEVNTSEKVATSATAPALGVSQQETTSVSSKNSTSSKKSPASVIPDNVVSPTVKQFIDKRFNESGRGKAPESIEETEEEKELRIKEEGLEAARKLENTKGAQTNTGKRRASLEFENKSSTHSLKPQTRAEMKETKEISKLTEASELKLPTIKENENFNNNKKSNNSNTNSMTTAAK